MLKKFELMNYRRAWGFATAAEGLECSEEVTVAWFAIFLYEVR